MKIRIICISLAAAGAILTSRIPADACTVCHSKNPNMVRMHEALEFKDCFKCHGPASARTMQGAKDEMTSDQLCAGCHAGEATTSIRKSLEKPTLR